MLLVYGAYGYTGALIARAAAAVGLPVLLGGRDGARLGPIAHTLGLPHRAFALEPGELDRGLADVDVVVHCAGPFTRTAGPMVDACLRRGVHYLDITGELDVFEALNARDALARTRGVMLLPGVGFDVVPSDSLAAHLARRLPGAQALTLAILSRGGVSHGTATTMLLHFDQGGAIRRGGRIVSVPTGSGLRRIDFGRGPRFVARIPWGDVSTAFYSTGIPDIEVCLALPLGAALAIRAAHVGRALTRRPFIRERLQRRIDQAAPGPDEARRAHGGAVLWGEVRTSTGQVARARLSTPDGYSHTVDAAVAIASRVLRGEVRPGFATPSMLLGPDFVLTLPGVSRVDLPTGA